MSRSDVVNAFQPAAEIEDPLRFAGREIEVRQLANALQVHGSVPLIYGDRGLGKSSLALQTSRIAQGDTELLAQVGHANLALEEPDRFIVFHVTCTDSTSNFESLLQLLINSVESIEFVPKGEKEAGELVDRTTRRKLALKVFEAESTRRYVAEAQRVSYQDLGLEEKLVQLSELVTKFHGSPVLFVIDELDRVRDTTGLASFLKASSGRNLKFLLVGIAANLSDLLEDHESIGRRLVPVLVHPMSDKDLRDIIRRTEKYLDHVDEAMTFESKATSQIIRVAAGFPWFVHVIGQAALLKAFDAGQDEVKPPDAIWALNDLFRNSFAQKYADLYQRAVRDSVQRETVLRALAEWRSVDIPTSEVYKVATALGVTGPSTYKGHLIKPEYGGVIYAPAFQARALVRFRDEMFKVYVRNRSSLYAGLKDRVTDRCDTVWRD